MDRLGCVRPGHLWLLSSTCTLSSRSMCCRNKAAREHIQRSKHVNQASNSQSANQPTNQAIHQISCNEMQRSRNHTATFKGRARCRRPMEQILDHRAALSFYFDVFLISLIRCSMLEWPATQRAFIALVHTKGLYSSCAHNVEL